MRIFIGYHVGYVGAVLFRWDRIRNGFLGITWGTLENINMLGLQVLMTKRDKLVSGVQDRCRSCYNGSGSGVQGGNSNNSSSGDRSSSSSSSSLLTDHSHGLPPEHYLAEEELLSQKLTCYCRLVLLLIFLAEQDSSVQGRLQVQSTEKNSLWELCEKETLLTVSVLITASSADNCAD